MQAPGRIIFNQLPDKMEIIIPAKKNWVTPAIFVSIVIFWAITGGVNSLLALPQKKEIDYSDWVWALWGIAVIAVTLRAILFITNAKEVIAVNAQTISIKKQGAVFSRTRRYELSKAQYFRVEESEDNDSLLDGRDRDEIGSGTICFYYNHKTVRFGEFITAPEAELILQRLSRKQLLTGKNL